MELLGPMDLIILGWECQGFSAAIFGESFSDTRSSLFTDMVRLITWAQSISPTLGYVIENTPSQLDQREKVQEHYMLVKGLGFRRTIPIQRDTMRFLCAPITQLVDQPCTILSVVVSFKIHHQRPQPIGFSHIG
jgi:hypothetical protein